jgi:peptidoglycan/xylan/chitin deacetylase (PgdA/CDA1 family)
MGAGIPFLMYHELARPGQPLCRAEQGYALYCIAEETFRAQLAWLRANAVRGWNVSQALDAASGANGAHDARGVGITFDDGCATDLHVAAPLLVDAGCSATFFVVSSWVGTPGFLTAADLRALRAAGFEVGAHSRTHAYLPDLAPDALHAEVAGAKDELEQHLGERVAHLSCPGGRWSPAVEAVARAAGYHSVSTSRLGGVGPSSDRFRLPRVAITTELAAGDFARVARGERRWVQEARHELLAGAKQLLGNSLYERVRGAVLGRGPA